MTAQARYDIVRSNQTAPPAEVQRDRYGRPLIQPLDGGKPEPYTRVSTLAKALDDLSQLMAWKQRKTAEGLVRRPDLLTRVAGALANGDPDTDWPTKRALNDVCGEAMEAAGSSKGSSAGTGFHSLTEAIDRGEEPLFVPAADQARLDAYREATRGYTALDAEVFVVCDELKAAGSFDRLWLCPDGQVRVGDLKTGKSEKAYPLATTMQIAINREGRLIFFNGAVDIGQGSTTVLTQIAADALGLPPDKVTLVVGDTGLTEDAGKSSASRQTFVSGNATRLAALALRKKILAANMRPKSRAQGEGLRAQGSGLRE